MVEDADLVFFQTGKFRWDGIVLVTGRNVSVAFKGASDTEIRGALIGSETNAAEPGGYFEFFNRTTDTMIVRASKQNIDMALQALYNMRITSYREVLQFAPLLVAVVGTALALGCQQAPARPGGGASVAPARRTSPEPSS